MPAVKSNNPTNAIINKNFIIRVKEPDWLKSKLTSANKIIIYLKDEKLKIKLFNEVLQGTKQVYTFKIRKRLTIEFSSK